MRRKRIKPKRFRSPAYRNHLRAKPCLGCGICPAGTIHHLLRGTGHGMGLSAGDDQAVPLCPRCHEPQHAGSLHESGNETRWFEERGIDPLAVAAQHYREWKDGR